MNDTGTANTLGYAYKDDGILKWMTAQSSGAEWGLYRYNTSGVFQDKPINVSTAGNVAIANNLTASGTAINFANLPTSDPSVAGNLWSNSGVVTVSAG